MCIGGLEGCFKNFIEPEFLWIHYRYTEDCAVLQLVKIIRFFGNFQIYYLSWKV